MDCREVVGDSKRLEDTQKIVMSALKADESQTRSLLSYLRLQVKKSQETAVKLLTEIGAHLAQTAQSQKNSTLENTVKLTKEFQLRSQNPSQADVSTSTSLIPWGKKPKQLSMQELSQELQNSFEKLNERKSLVEELADEQFEKIPGLEKGIQLLENEIRFLTDLNSWILSLKGIENKSSIELHEFALGVEDQISIMDKQVEVLKGQKEAMEKSIKLLGQENREIERFLSLDWPMTQSLIQRQVALIPKVNVTPTTKASNVNLSLSDLAKPFRTFLSGDQIRFIKTKWLSKNAAEGYYAVFWLEEITPGIFEKHLDQKGQLNPVVTLDLGKNKMNWLTLQRTGERVFKKKFIDINKRQNAYQGYESRGSDVYVLANPEMDIEGFKLDQILVMDRVINLKPIWTESEQFILLGQILGTQLYCYRYCPGGGRNKLEFSQRVNVVAVKLFYYEPKTKTVVGNYYTEISQSDIRRARAYEGFKPNEN